MKKLFAATVVSILSLSVLTSCNEVEVENGEVPSEYVSQVKTYLGPYKGLMDGQPTEITLSMSGNTPVMTVKNSYGDDLLLRNCKSVPGRLLTVTARNIGNKKYELGRVTFAFSSGRCSWIDGNIVTLEFTNQTKFNLSIVDKDTRAMVCPPTGPSISGAPPADPTCTEVGNVTYFRGQFSK